MTRAAGVVPAQTEAAFQAQLISLFRLAGWRVYHTHDSRRSSPGFPDLVLLRPGPDPGHLLMAEVKSAHGAVTAEQDAWIEGLRGAGVDARVWRPADWAEAVNVAAGKDARPV